MGASLPLRRILANEARSSLHKRKDFASLMVLDFQEGDFESAREWATAMGDQHLHGEPDLLSALLLSRELRGEYRTELKEFLGGARVLLIGPAPIAVADVGLNGYLVARFEEGAKKVSEQRFTNVAFEDTLSGRAPLKFCQNFDVVFGNTSNVENIVSHAPLMTTSEELRVGAHWPIGVPFSGTSALLALSLYGVREFHVEGLNFYLSPQHYSEDYIGQPGFYEAHWANSAHDYLANIGYVSSIGKIIRLGGNSQFLAAIGAGRVSLCRTYDQNFWKQIWESKHRQNGK